ncbi:hypothetical protein TNCV_3474971 [Trichonephila clavipes]|nr:hypothetical protein TNCV_3474971 [Trichonephila clavipes]
MEARFASHMPSDLGPLTTEQNCSNKALTEKEKDIYRVRINYVKKMLQVETNYPSPTSETKLTLEAELKTLEAKIKSMEGKMTEFLPRRIALSPHKINPKAIKRSAAPVIKPAKTNKLKNPTDPDFVFPKKTV